MAGVSTQQERRREKAKERKQQHQQHQQQRWQQQQQQQQQQVDKPSFDVNSSQLRRINTSASLNKLPCLLGGEKDKQEDKILVYTRKLILSGLQQSFASHQTRLATRKAKFSSLLLRARACMRSVFLMRWRACAGARGSIKVKRRTAATADKRVQSQYCRASHDVARRFAVMLCGSVEASMQNALSLSLVV